MQRLTRHGVEYLLVGGYAVGYQRYPRAIGDHLEHLKRNKVAAGRAKDLADLEVLG